LEWRFVVESGEMCVLGRWRVCVYGGCVARLLGFLGKLVLMYLMWCEFLMDSWYRYLCLFPNSSFLDSK